MKLMGPTLKTVGDWNAQIDIPLNNALAASIDLTGRSGRDACQHAMILMAKSAAVLTKQSKALRPIVRNPDDGWKTDGRKAPWGVMKYSGDQDPKFVPIFRTGEYGRVRFIDKKTYEITYINSGTGEVFSRTQYEQQPGLSIKTDKRRKIPRHGLAKKSWMWGLSGLPKHPRIEDPIPGVAQLNEYLSGNSCGLILTNKLRYINKATPSGLEETVARKASNQIMAQAAKRLEDRFGVMVPRLAASKARRKQKTLPEAYKQGALL
jgi:hypothetical protein